jgi:Ras GTPase-activating-like protein IQGAP2/3
VAGRKKLQKNVSTTGPNSGAWIDEERQNLRAYEYLCHVGEAKEYQNIVIVIIFK